MKLKSRIKQHINANSWQYILITLIFTVGLIIGNYKVPSLEGGVRSHLLELLDKYLQADSQDNMDGAVLLFYAFLNQAKSLIGIWFLGLTVIGMPLILAVVFMKGFSLGFTIGFLVQEKAGTGIFIAILSILPQNLVYIPLLIIWSVVAVKFSIFIATGRQSRVGSLGRALISYSMLLLIFLIIVLIGAFIEAYFSPWFLHNFI